MSSFFLAAACGSPTEQTAQLAQGADSDPELISYGDLARRDLVNIFNTVLSEVAAFDQDTMPHDEVNAKALRKDVGRLKRVIDIFAYALPRDPDKDQMLKLRSLVDDGYAVVGEFKDMFDSQGLELAVFNSATGEWGPGVKPADIIYNKDELKDRRKAVLKWKDKFTDADRVARYQEFLASADADAVHDRPKKDLAKFYWGGVEERPRLELKGFANIRFMALGQTRAAKAMMPHLTSLSDLTIHENEEEFHDFRKRTRGIAATVADFSGIVKGDAEFATKAKILDDLAKKYGKLHDKLMRYHRVKDGLASGNANTLAAEINAEWATVKAWQESQNLGAKLDVIAAAFVALNQGDGQ